MGQEINDINFTQADFTEFLLRLKRETRLLEKMLENDCFESVKPVAGYELEAWLIDQQGNPAPANEEFLQKLDDNEVVSELAQFNVELNGQPKTLEGNTLSLLQAELTSRWHKYQEISHSMGLDLLAIGILPTVQEHDLCLANMSKLKRYQALNHQILRLRKGRPIDLHIKGKESLKLEHDDVMLEAAATSLQIHLQLDATQAGKYYNLAKIISAPMVAVSANSPFLFGKQLWEESRIPLFEQSISVGGSDYSSRVTFGIRYVRKTIQEVFAANCERYPVLLPMLMDEAEESLSHMRLHNGTIWRWNRPLVGFNQHGIPHLRIEHRVVPAGPTHIDQIANAAFFFGLITALAQKDDLEQRISHQHSKDNFYRAAKYGMDTKVNWLDGEVLNLRRLCLDKLLPIAQHGLAMLKINDNESKKYLGIIAARLRNRQTGSSWQKQWVQAYGNDWHKLTLDYRYRQNTQMPVHTWKV